MKEFRLLRNDEIDVRVAKITTNAIMLLLYKDARCDMNILDETVGPLNWKRAHTRDNANCIVSIWDPDKKEWISKEDTGTESNTEKEKGLASDSFKRACFNWGIGRELYTSPNMFFPAGMTKASGGKCYDNFKVVDIKYNDRVIAEVTIRDVTTRKEMTFGSSNDPDPGNAKTPKKIDDIKAKTIENIAIHKDIPIEKLLSTYKVSKLTDMTEDQYLNCIKRLKAS